MQNMMSPRGSPALVPPWVAMTCCAPCTVAHVHSSVVRNARERWGSRQANSATVGLRKARAKSWM
eukprot:11216042-Lingulodinium_polyedra.AAC.1